MGNDLVKLDAVNPPAITGEQSPLPAMVERAGNAARFAWEEFFFAEHHNPHTQRAYLRAVRRFLEWAESEGLALPQITPGMVGKYLTALSGSPAKRNQHRAALRGLFDRLVQRHVVALNPVASVRAVKEQVIEGKTPEITLEQARTLLAGIRLKVGPEPNGGEDDRRKLNLVGLRDRAILATLKFTACRAGAVAKLRLGDFQHDGSQYVLRFREKGGKSREIPVRHDLEGYIRLYLDAAGIADEDKDRPLFRSAVRRTRRLTENPMTTKSIGELVKRRLKDVGLPERLSPHSFRVSAVTDLLTQGVPLEDVQYLVGHSSPRTTKLYDRRQKKVSRNIVERITN